MRAVVDDRYGPPEVLRIAEVARPAPAAGEVLVHVHASTANQTDAHMRAGATLIRLLTGIRRPRQRITGLDFAGVVEAVGEAVTEFKEGDRVFGIRAGANAEYLAVREHRAIALMPAGLTFEGAAAVPDGALAALAHLRRAHVGDRTRLLVYGASGACGSAAVQLGKVFGARVTGVCSTPNVELVRSLGADEVIDYTTRDWTRNGETYDVVLDAVGKHSFLKSRRSIRPGGMFVPTDRLINLFWWGWTARIGSRRVAFSLPRVEQVDLRYIAELIEAGRYRPVIDRTYPLERVVEAHRYVESWRKRGSVVLKIG